MNEFGGKTVVVTGGSRGIGFEVVKAFLAKGANVVFCGVNEQNLKKAEGELGPGDNLHSIKADVGVYSEAKSLIEQTIERHGAIDILVNNAGVAWTGDFAKQDIKSIDKLIDVNIKGVLHCTKAVLPHMIKRKNGTIVNVASGAGKKGHSGLATYSATKFAVVGFTEALAGEVHDKNVKVFAICPGPVNTDMIYEIYGKRFGLSPKKVAISVLKLAS